MHTCIDCGAMEREDIPQLEHRYKDWVTLSGSKLTQPVIKEKTCDICGRTELHRDWSYIWITILVVLAIIGVTTGMVYISKEISKKS